MGNLSNTELGVTKLGVRHYLELSSYAEAEGLNLVAEYLTNKSNIITSTSMSRGGFWSKNFVTQIKTEKKETLGDKPKKSWFSKPAPEGLE